MTASFIQSSVDFFDYVNSATYKKIQDRLICDEFKSLPSVHRVLDDLQPPRNYSIFKLYGSGEITCGYVCPTGYSVVPPVAAGPRQSTVLTPAACTKIRRAVENSEDYLKYFYTFTFAPAALHPWQIDDKGVVIQEFAKYKIRKVLDTMRHFIKRADVKHAQNHDGECRPEWRYIWVAELQKNGNIHFHVLHNRYFPLHDLPAKKAGLPLVEWGPCLTRWWGQAVNSVDVAKLNDNDHAGAYIRKYMSKNAGEIVEQSTITGNRYNISKELRIDMKPKKQVIKKGWTPSDVQDDLAKLISIIEDNGGTILDFGFSLPRPSRSKTFRDEHGKAKKTKGHSESVNVAVWGHISR